MFVSLRVMAFHCEATHLFFYLQFLIFSILIEAITSAIMIFTIFRTLDLVHLSGVLWIASAHPKGKIFLQK